MEKHEFQPKEWVLVRDDDDEEWTLNIFSHKSKDYFHCVSSMWEQCLPYEGNEALLGKTDAPKEKHVWHAGDRVDVLSDFDDMWHPGLIVEIDYTRSEAGFSYRVESKCFKDMNGRGACWCRADQLRKPEEKPNEEFKFGDKVKYRTDDDKWVDGLFVMADDSTIPYLVYLPDENDTEWGRREDVRRA